MNEAEITAARALARTIGVYRWKTAVDLKGTEAREHIGPTVQRAIEVMLAHGLDPFNYGFICYDKWEAKTIEHDAVEDEDPQIARAAWTESILAGDRYAFRYDELNQFILAGMEAAQTAVEAQLATMLARAH
ncbi:tail fiber domain-containing protein [Janthinobacterium lividum]|nr:tail fiber domain-containing protein [Janthinobacterium lividum]